MTRAGRRGRWCASVDSTGLVVPGSGRVVAVVGLDDVVVVDTPDALLVTTRARAQDVKGVVAGLREDGQRPDLSGAGPGSDRVGLGRVGVGVVGHERLQRLAAGLGAVLPDADLLAARRRRRRPTSA